MDRKKCEKCRYYLWIDGQQHCCYVSFEDRDYLRTDCNLFKPKG